MKKNFKEKMLDNNGFSLVELIIVVAIMVVLVGVLSPTYLKYVEKSRIAADTSNIDTIVKAIQVYAADSDTTYPLIDDAKITLTRTDEAVVDNKDTTNKELELALANSGLDKKTLPKLQNKQSFEKVDLTVKVDSTTKYVTVETKYYISDGKGGFTQVNADGSTYVAS